MTRTPMLVRKHYLTTSSCARSSVTTSYPVLAVPGQDFVGHLPFRQKVIRHGANFPTVFASVRQKPQDRMVHLSRPGARRIGSLTLVRPRAPKAPKPSTSLAWDLIEYVRD